MQSSMAPTGPPTTDGGGSPRNKSHKAIHRPEGAAEGAPWVRPIGAVSIKRFDTGASAPACNRIALSGHQGDNRYIVPQIFGKITVLFSHVCRLCAKMSVTLRIARLLHT